MKRAIVIAVLAMGVAVGGAEEAKMQFTLSSPSFQNNQPMPAKHSCEGMDVSPALNWDGVPANAKGFALICDDPDAPGGTWVHWVIYGIPAGTTELPENVAKTDSANGAKQGVNDFGRVGYGGPCPPPGRVHHYHFRLYALDAELNLAPRVSRRQLESAMKGHIVAQTELVGTYQRE
jgi:Raf kinase inhibitor-like YbhB/YbcL family protein